MAEVPHEEIIDIINGTEIYVLRCPSCNKILAIIYRAGSATMPDKLSNCDHFEWKRIGNGCYDDPDQEYCKGARELIERAVKVYFENTNVYLLIPRT